MDWTVLSQLSDGDSYKIVKSLEDSIASEKGHHVMTSMSPITPERRKPS